MHAIYNEIEPFAASWLEALSGEGHIATGRVDRRSILELGADDVAGPGQRHFFAGIGGWSRALRLAGVPDDANVWTASCPCQPFSDAGSGEGVRDARHLWPTLFALIQQCRPAVLFGEQVASRAGLAWLDLVYADLEGCGYTVGAADLPAASVGAPHIRQRLFFVAYADPSGLRELGRPGLRAIGDAPRRHDADRRSEDGILAHAPGRGRLEGDALGHRSGVGASADAGRDRSAGDRESSGVAHAQEERHGSRGRGRTHGRATIKPVRHGPHSSMDHPDGTRPQGLGTHVGHADQRPSGSASSTHVVVDSDGLPVGLGLRRQDGREDHAPGRGGEAGLLGDTRRTRTGRDTGAGDRPEGEGAGNGHPDGRERDGAVPPGPTDWSVCDWIPCSDGVSRPVEPGTQPLAHGVPGRVGLLRGYGNAIVSEVAAVFIRAAIEAVC